LLLISKSLVFPSLSITLLSTIGKSTTEEVENPGDSPLNLVLKKY
jgi:hypothetical protein